VAHFAGSREQPLGVHEVVRLAAKTVDALGLMWLEGEVTQASKPGSGHIYFSIRERECVLAAVMWGRDAQRLPFAIEAGRRLRVRGRLGVYDRDGKMQLYADFAEPAGLGSDALAREQLKAKLAAEGMFAAAKKRPLPRFPRRIGVVTSAKGAAVHDIIQTVQRRFPTPILIADAAVQGPTAPAQLVNGMAMVVRAGCDVVIVGRGGGAATDLTAFDHERVVRTISRCPVPVVSAVGHEVDLTLADLAADARASTPTAAAELCVPDRVALGEMVTKERRRLDRELRHALGRAAQDLDRLALRLTSAHPGARLGKRRGELAELAARAATAMRRRVQARRAELVALSARADAALARRVQGRRAELARLAGKLDALSPVAVLERGYAVVLRDGHVVRDAGEVAAGERLRVRLARGELVVREDGDDS
jgi:exodeoxyribonuclease VII large subunit